MEAWLTGNVKGPGASTLIEVAAVVWVRVEIGRVGRDTRTLERYITTLHINTVIEVGGLAEMMLEVEANQ